jgi:hypothetical protein
MCAIRYQPSEEQSAHRGCSDDWDVSMIMSEGESLQPIGFVFFYVGGIYSVLGAYFLY